MKNRETRTALEVAALELRRIVMALEPGVLIGSEDELVERLNCSRSTVRQVARLLEREGLLKVRRGLNGGYFSARPDAGTIEGAVSTYLEFLDIDPRDVTALASSLWVQAMRKAAEADPVDARRVAEKLIAKVRAIKDDAAFAKIRELELLAQAEIFELAQSVYVKLIFDINVAFSRRRFTTPIADDASDEHHRFVREWRNAKLMELSALIDGDIELAGLAAKHSRKIWHQRIIARFAQ